MEGQVKGEVRRLAEIFSVEDAESASRHVQTAIQSQQQVLQTLQGFLEDNQDLKKLVQELPEKISHQIMVPLGKRAFVPGRLVHTNEFLVLLGESYYAECSTKQTLDVLDRREKLLNSQIAGVKAQLDDINAESRFFSETLAEAAAGVVEIREEFVESTSEASSSAKGMDANKSDPAVQESGAQTGISQNTDDKEDELIMARLAELEAAEAAADKEEEEEEEEEDNDVDDEEPQHKTKDPDTETSSKSSDEKHINKAEAHGQILSGCPSIRSPADLLKFEEWKRSNLATENVMKEKNLDYKERKVFSIQEKGMELPREAINVINAPSDVLKEKTTATVSKARTLDKDNALKPHEECYTKQSEEKFCSLEQRNAMQKSTQDTARKAFTGTVLERTGPTFPTDPSQRPDQAQKRPVSKFKMRQADK